MKIGSIAFILLIFLFGCSDKGEITNDNKTAKKEIASVTEIAANLEIP